MFDYAMDQVSLPPLPPGVTVSASEPGPDIATAIREQLGLRLVPGKAMLDVLVIDKAEKAPTAN